MKQKVNNLYQTLNTICLEENGYIFPNEKEECEYYNMLINDINNIFNYEDDLLIIFDIFQDMSTWHLDYSYCKIIINKNNLNALKEFVQSTAYGYLCVENLNLVWGYLSKNEFINMDIVSRYMAQSFILGWENEGNKIALNMINSLNFVEIENEETCEHKIIGKGHPQTLASWFILNIYCKFNNYFFNYSNFNYPPNMDIYEQIISMHNIEDLNIVDSLITILSDKHIEQTQESKSDDEYMEFCDTSSWLFPYEILTWLKLRELKGLKNPKTFTHPLMNTPIAKMFLNLKEPLPYPKELPYAKELLEKLKEQCSDVEIPEWLDGAKSDGIENEKVEDRKEENNKGDDIIPDDFFVKE